MGEVPPFFGRDRVVLFQKEGGSPSHSAAWRPITLLNADYSMVVSLLVSCLLSSFLQLVRPVQTCDVPERKMFSSLSHTGLVRLCQFRSFVGCLSVFRSGKGISQEPFPVLGSEGVWLSGFVSLSTEVALYWTDQSFTGEWVASCTFSVHERRATGLPFVTLTVCSHPQPMFRRLAQSSRIRGFPLRGRDGVQVSAYADD